MVHGIPKKSLIICSFFGNLAAGVTLTSDDGIDPPDVIVDPNDAVERAWPDDVAVALPCFVVFSY